MDAVMTRFLKPVGFCAETFLIIHSAYTYMMSFYISEHEHLP
jgi:hypothetical protein